MCNRPKVIERFSGGRAEPSGIVFLNYPWREEVFRLGRKIREHSVRELKRRFGGISTELLRLETLNERKLLKRAFTRSLDSSRSDNLYAKLFLQYLRVKTALFRLLVHSPGEGSPGESGLEHFLRHFSQIKVYAPDADSVRPRPPQEPGLAIGATEYRVAPDAWLKTFSWEPEMTAEFGSSEWGWIIHFKRTKRDRFLPLYRTQIQSLEADGRCIAAALHQKPSRLRSLRGIDICGVEGWQPLWVSAQTLKAVRAASRKVVAFTRNVELSPLHLTLHAGEDYRWLTSGMRAISEPFVWGLIERGDRIGHAIAITLDPLEWWKRHSREPAEVKVIDRFLDLAFLAKYTRKMRTPAQTQWLSIELDKVTETLWPHLDRSGFDVLVTAEELWKGLGSTVLRRLMKSTRRPELPSWKQLVWDYLWRPSVQRRASTVLSLSVDVDQNSAATESEFNERDLLVLARDQLISEVARWQVCIESNPSSNLLIGSLDSMACQDFLQIRPTSISRRGAETLTWTISTDDPITFATTLADEYAYAWAGMVVRDENPYDPSYARALLDEAAVTSMRMRFTVAPRDRGAGREGSAFKWRRS